MPASGMRGEKAAPDRPTAAAGVWAGWGTRMGYEVWTWNFKMDQLELLFAPANQTRWGSIQLDIENSIEYSIDFSIEFCSTVGHPVKLNRNLNRIFNRVFNIQLN